MLVLTWVFSASVPVHDTDDEQDEEEEEDGDEHGPEPARLGNRLCRLLYNNTLSSRYNR